MNSVLEIDELLIYGEKVRQCMIIEYTDVFKDNNKYECELTWSITIACI